jgi:4'-phosphopantetheinyl transferase
MAIHPATSPPPHQPWERAPHQPTLTEGVLHVWRAELSAVPDDLDGLLSTAERTRAERFLRARDRQLWMRAHGVLRALLGRYLDCDPQTLNIATGAHGKPALVEDRPSSSTPQPTRPTRPRPAFNLSHSGQVALYAFTQASAVGVDIELARRSINEVTIAARTFGSAEAKRLQALDASSREREFLRLWARHEAALKYRGTGIGQPGARQRDREPWVTELDVGPRAAAAVAVPEPPCELRCWDWHIDPTR